MLADQVSERALVGQAVRWFACQARTAAEGVTAFGELGDAFPFSGGDRRCGSSEYLRGDVLGHFVSGHEFGLHGVELVGEHSGCGGGGFGGHVTHGRRLDNWRTSPQT
jgi:hypothetical protein